MRKNFMLSVLIVFAFSISGLNVLAQPEKTKPNDVTLYLSNGTIDQGLLIDIKVAGSLRNRTVMIWNGERGYITYPVQDIEALTHNYDRKGVERDLNRYVWNRQEDFVVTIDSNTNNRTGIIKGVVSDYRKNTGDYMVGNKKYKFINVGAVYFFNSDHAHFTNKRNPFAQPPTLTKDTSSTGLLKESAAPFARQPNRPPNYIINLPATSRYHKVTNVNTGDRFIIKASGQIRVKPGLYVGPEGKMQFGESKIKKRYGLGAVLAFVAPALATNLKIKDFKHLSYIGSSNIYTAPVYGALYITINDKVLADNSGGLEIKIWRLK